MSTNVLHPLDTVTIDGREVRTPELLRLVTERADALSEVLVDVARRYAELAVWADQLAVDIAREHGEDGTGRVLDQVLPQATTPISATVRLVAGIIGAHLGSANPRLGLDEAVVA